MKSTISSALIIGLLLGAGLGAGCTNADGGKTPVEGDAFLTIVGESNVFMETGWQQAIVVRYHDSADHPLAGQIGFVIKGPANGASLSAPTAVTDADGKATVTLASGTNGDAAFAIDADAEYAPTATWHVAIHHAEPTGPLDPSGTYKVTSQFDMVSGLPGAVGTVTNTFIDMTDGPNDPATFFLDQAVNNISDSTTRNLINATRPALDAIVNDALRSSSPQLVNNLITVGHDFGLIARKFGLQSTMAVSAAPEGFVANHTLTHVVFNLDTQTFQYTMASLGMSNLSDANVGWAQTDDRTDIGSHQFPISYGSVLMVGLNNVILPLVHPGSTNLATFLSSVVDCNAVGTAIANYIGFGSSSLYRGACQVGVTAAANYIEGRIRSLDSSALILSIGGNAKPMDTNTDRKIDLLQDGAWTGTVTYAGAPVTLGASTFRGERVTTTN